jgi:hypothetical protein
VSINMPLQIEPVDSLESFSKLVEDSVQPHEVFDAQGDEHGHIDGDLQDAIEAVLIPLVGHWENSDTWFHNQNFYGNGIRSLSFRSPLFPWSAVEALQKCLTGEARDFCIEIALYENLEVNGRLEDAIAILQGKVIATRDAAVRLQESVL